MISNFMQPGSFPPQQHRKFTKRQPLKLRQTKNNISVTKSAVMRGLGMNEEITWKPARNLNQAQAPCDQSNILLYST